MSPFEQIIQLYYQAVPVWQAKGLVLAKQLFMTLAGIQLTWQGILWMMNKDDPTNLMLEFVKKLMVILFFWMVLVNYEVWVPAIYNSLRDIGVQMTGSTNLSPSGIMQRGIELASLVMAAAKHGGFIEKIFGSILASAVGLIIFWLFMRIGLTMVLTIAGGQILLTGGIIFLAFAGSQWTRQYAERYLTAVVSVGVQLLFITLLIGIGDNLSQGWASILSNADKSNLVEVYLSILAASFVYSFLCTKIPDLAVSMFTGSFSFGFDQGSGGMIKTGATLAAIGAGITPRLASGFIKGTAGAASAVSQAVTTASKQASESGKSSIISTASRAVRTLGSTSLSMVKQKASESISKTTGGRIANQIRTLNAVGPSKDDKEQPKK